MPDDMNSYESYYTINPQGKDGKGLEQIEHDLSDIAMEGATSPQTHNAFTSPDGKFTVNIWACDPGTLQIRDLAIDEACFLIKGEVHLTDMYDKKTIYKAGDAFLLPKGFCGTWHMPFPLLKYNSMYTR